LARFAGLSCSTKEKEAVKAHVSVKNAWLLARKSLLLQKHSSTPDIDKNPACLAGFFVESLFINEYDCRFFKQVHICICILLVSLITNFY
jgi:hypothetical protein